MTVINGKLLDTMAVLYGTVHCYGKVKPTEKLCLRKPVQKILCGRLNCLCK